MVEYWRMGTTATIEAFKELTGTHPAPEALIIPGSGLRPDPNSPLGARVSWDTELRLQAASNYVEELAKQGHLPKIFLCGGKVYPGFLPIARYAEDHLRKTNPNLPVKNIETTTNTLEDIRHAAKHMSEEGLSKGLVISNNHHLAAKVLALNYGLSFMSAEHLIFQTDPASREYITKLEASPLVQQLKRQQMIRAALLLLPGGLIPYDILAHRTLEERANYSLLS